MNSCFFCGENIKGESHVVTTTVCRPGSSTTTVTICSKCYNNTSKQRKD